MRRAARVSKDIHYGEAEGEETPRALVSAKAAVSTQLNEPDLLAWSGAHQNPLRPIEDQASPFAHSSRSPNTFPHTSPSAAGTNVVGGSPSASKMSTVSVSNSILANGTKPIPKPKKMSDRDRLAAPYQTVSPGLGTDSPLVTVKRSKRP